MSIVRFDRVEIVTYLIEVYVDVLLDALMIVGKLQFILLVGEFLLSSE